MMVNNSKFGFVDIDRSDDSRLEAYRSLKGKQLERDGIFIAEGEKVIQSMVDSGCRIVSCLITRSSKSKYKRLLKIISKRKVTIYVASDRLIGDIIGFRFHKGIMAVGRCPKKLNVRQALKMRKRQSIFVALNGVNDPQNVGLIARNAAAFGAGAMIVDNTTYDPYYRKAVRVSMGTIFCLPVFYEDDLKSSLIYLREKYGARIIAATPGKRARNIRDVELNGNICFVFGNEDRGVSRNILRTADYNVRIPISKEVDSLNVASASAVCLYEASHRHERKTK